MKQLGLIGHPLTHSFSKKYYENKFLKEGIVGYVYDLFDLSSIEEFHKVLQKENLIGVNVTIPYKEAVLPFLDEIEPAAKSMQAVNCIRIRKNNNKLFLKGFNTDIIGFKKSLHPLLAPHHKAALILGNGGAAQAVKKALEDLHISYSIISRSPKGENQYSYDQIDEKMMNTHPVVINCSPVGTFPNIDEKPDIPYSFISKNHLFYDLIYNPEETKFLEIARKAGAKTKNGYEMLVLQAEENWKIWNET